MIKQLTTVGNSKAVILPAALVKKYKLDRVVIEETDEGILIRPVEQPQPVLSFDVDVKPILQTRCSPCHFPGGKMYDTMPFDKTLTIRKHSAGILRRIKGEEAEKIKAFLEQ